MSLELLNKRLQYYGGNQEQRFISDKLRSLKKALLYSYQAATAVLSDGREFRCLINPDKNKPAYDNKIISIPYKDICLNSGRKGKMSEGQEQIGLKPGDVFTWKETNSHWLVYLQFLEEDAYFRSQIRRCDQQIDIDGHSYWVYLRGPVETSIQWSQKAKIEWNSLNYSMVMYLTADDITKKYFQRFKTIKILDPRYDEEKTWQVVGVDPYYGDGILQVFLDEYFENIFEDENNKLKQQQQQIIDKSLPRIDGPKQIVQYGREYYSIVNATGGKWLINWKGEQIDLNNSSDTILLDIPVGDLETFDLIYQINENDRVILNIDIVAL